MFRFVLIVIGDGGGDAGGITAICRCQSRRVRGNETRYSQRKTQSFPNPVAFVPKPNQGISTVLSQREAACKEMCKSFRQIHGLQKRTLPTFLS